jgi:hypothetical protein
VTQTVGLIALADTLLDAAGAPSDARGQARVLPRQDGEGGMSVYSEGLLWGLEKTSLISGDYKIIYHPHRDPQQQRFEVYDRRRDRAEQHDLADSQEAADLRERLVALTAASEETAAEWERSGRQSEAIELSDETRARLRALGYIAD